MFYYALIAFCYAAIGGFLSFLLEDEAGWITMFYGVAWPFILSVNTGRIIAFQVINLKGNFLKWVSRL